MDIEPRNHRGTLAPAFGTFRRPRRVSPRAAAEMAAVGGAARGADIRGGRDDRAPARTPGRADARVSCTDGTHQGRAADRLREGGAADIVDQASTVVQ